MGDGSFSRAISRGCKGSAADMSGREVAVRSGERQRKQPAGAVKTAGGRLPARAPAGRLLRIAHPQEAHMRSAVLCVSALAVVLAAPARARADEVVTADDAHDLQMRQLGERVEALKESVF